MTPQPSFDLPTGSFATGVLVVSYVCRRCYTSPNPPPENVNEKDTIMNSFTGRYSHDFHRLLVTVIGAYHAYLTLFPPTEPSAICPNPSNLNARLFGWHPFTAIILGIMFVAGCIRIQAYRQLGKDFTFELAPPSRLTTTGMYRYVRHPSYITKALVAMPLTLFYLREDGPLGCFLPKIVVQYRMFSMVVWLLKFATGDGGWSKRVKEEEDMLRRTFGKEWDDYAAKTARYIPFIY